MADTRYAYTGGRPAVAGQPTLVFVHGAGHDHSVWNMPARHFAHHGFNVLAPDLPGHGRSGGTPLTSIEALADWLMDWLASSVDGPVILVGHSMGSLIALRAAATYPDRVARLVLVGSVVPMPVAAPLLDATLDARDKAHAMINQWSYTPAHHLGASAQPGMVLTSVNRRLMERCAPGVLHTDMAACNAYTAGEADAGGITAPTRLICGARDQMTPPKAARALQTALAKVPSGAHIIILPDAGHAMMAEAPDAFLDALRGFIVTA
ncbi:alpha/beta fold hydrolase [Denitromonas iodatirespirans]|uniref:Alpha/beta hydrolase n=1 Tax=Denitromonas iodatirespirans TaxID=2795389 RepID=A0A944DIQ9_DENI1|nr:alpha/beta hydrolase [Denitromonas iodatirespirans]MBT0963633.1 alpha/beta hydrolase [Denitromonas iodatirespirans]